MPNSPWVILIGFLAALSLLGLGSVLYWALYSRPQLLKQVSRLELEALSQAGAALVGSTQNVEELCELIYQQATNLIDTNTFQVGLFEEETYRIQVWVVDGERKPPATFNLSQNRGLVGWARDHKTTIVVHDFQKEMAQLPARPRYVSDSPPRSAIFIPFVSGDDVLGILAAQNHRPNFFNDNHLQFLNVLANQAGSAIANARLYEEALEKERLAQELQVAQQIQASLIPAGNPKIPGLEVASVWQAARQVSGDFYDFFQLNDGRWGIVVADVADKGMPAAIFMAVSRTILRSVAFRRESPANILKRTNELIFNDSQSDLFVTVFYAIWDNDANCVRYACGGHNPAIHLNSQGEMRLLHTDGIALGVIEKIAIEEKKIALRPDEEIVLYTDGITEAFNPNQEEFGLARLEETLQKYRHLPANEQTEAVIDALNEFTGEQSLSDDLTLVILKRR